MQVTRRTSSTAAGTDPGSLRYLHNDHLGSTAAVSNEAGQVIERMAYDPWGKRRNTNGLVDATDNIVGLTTDRGYTLHEHLDEVGIVHMNGRLYDPLAGRFMSADPFIQAPHNLKSFNRYSYVWNNPLVMFDPDGYAEEYATDFTGGTYFGPNADYSGPDASFAGYGFSFDQSTGSIAPACAACSSQFNGVNSAYAQWVGVFVAQQFNPLVFKEEVTLAQLAARTMPAPPGLLPGQRGKQQLDDDGLPMTPPSQIVSLPSWLSDRIRDVISDMKSLADKLTTPGLAAAQVISIMITNAAGLNRIKDVPDRGRPGEVIEGQNRTREYGLDGKPSRDYDKPHQGYERPHVHDWADGKREHPGRDYSPWPRD